MKENKMKTITGIAAAAAVALAPLTALALPAPAHADTECGGSPRVVAVGSTSCPFALNVANKMMSGAGNSFMAYSPTTGESYLMSCSIIRHGSTTCMGGNGAEVDIY
jgi:hypothetical protein